MEQIVHHGYKRSVLFLFTNTIIYILIRYGTECTPWLQEKRAVSAHKYQCNVEWRDTERSVDDYSASEGGQSLPEKIQIPTGGY